jgi:hypothetical protein
MLEAHKEELYLWQQLFEPDLIFITGVVVKQIPAI